MTRAPPSLRLLWPHQEAAIENLRAALRAGKTRPLLQAPTGAGETTIAARMTAIAIARRKRVLFISPYGTLVDQTCEAFEAEGIWRIGIMQADRPTDPIAPVQVGTVQTLARREKPDVELVFVDEAHRLDERLFGWMRSPEMAGVPFIGLSATPWTAGLGRHYDHLVIAATTRELIEADRLSRFVVYAPSAPDLAAVRVVAGDFHERQLSDVTNTPKLVGDIIQNWRDRARDLSTIAFCVNRDHARHVEQRFRETGVASEYLDGETPHVVREAIFRRFREGQTKVIVNVDVLTAGFDADVRCVIDARPTKSEIRYVQSIGRGLRTAPGKDRLVILDHAGNTERLGFVDAIHHDNLDDGNARDSAKIKAERKAADVRLCQECKFVLQRATLICSDCGFEELATTPVVEIDARLVEFGQSADKTSAPCVLDQAAFFAELKFIAREKNYSAGWAAHKFRERFGYWPNAPLVRFAEPQMPTLKTFNWVKSRRIAFGRGQKHA
jgi:DNA repair protein RadD